MTRVRAALLTSLASLSIACTNPLDIGEECNDSAQCMEGMSCIFRDATRTIAVCMEDCTVAVTRLCEGGPACIPAELSDGTPREFGVCFLGGPTAVGEPCVDSFECALGALCVGQDPLGAPGEPIECPRDTCACLLSCDTADGSNCAAGETCTALLDMGTNGYCAAAP